MSCVFHTFSDALIRDISGVLAEKWEQGAWFSVWLGFESYFDEVFQHGWTAAFEGAEHVSLVSFMGKQLERELVAFIKSGDRSLMEIQNLAASVINRLMSALYDVIDYRCICDGDGGSIAGIGDESADDEIGIYDDENLDDNPF
jgi:hypothetical protein